MNSPAPLAEELTAEYGDVLPPTLITNTVTAAWFAVPSHDDGLVRATACADVAGLAEAVVRCAATSRS